ncbi:MFS transporter [Microbacterium sp. LRZ72]|uniref:MFS transporter n=1 Tax=Microbacterium sp. LRZ72 TaxID=2942481 RepID=UPI0029AB9B53|nr:MFS transporter [Microbacterium sp. LRZ72]MDX2376061.1 MFS transporter [Microbacterium sp. LRZ72]
MSDATPPATPEDPDRTAAPATPHDGDSRSDPGTRSIPISSKQQWRAFWVCVAVAGLTILDLSKVNVALPSIEEGLGSGPTALQLVVAGYVLTFGLVLVPSGRIGDQRSRRALFITGLTLFTLTSIMCALAPNTLVLMIGRLLQGVAAGIQMPQVLGLIQELFRGRDRGRAFGLFGATIGVATALGPTLGGLLIALGGPEDGWRLIFWMNVPLCVIAIGLAAWVLPTTRKRAPKRLELDPVGVVLFGIVILSLMWPFLFTTGSPDDDPRRWWVLVVFVLFGAAFIAWERRYSASGKNPLIPFSIFRRSSYRNGTLLATSYFTGLPALFLLTTLFLQGGLDLAPVYAGLVTMGFALPSALTSWIGGNLVNKYGRPIVLWGLTAVLTCIAGLVLIALYVPAEWAPISMAAVMVLGGAGGGFVISPNQTLALSDVPVKQGGLAGSVGQLGQRIGTAVGTAVALSLFYATIYREQDEASTLVVYHDAYMYGMLAVALFVSIAFVLGVIDLSSRRRKKRRRARRG